MPESYYRSNDRIKNELATEKSQVEVRILRLSGRSFQTVGPAMLKALGPYVSSLCLGTNSFQRVA